MENKTFSKQLFMYFVLAFVISWILWLPSVLNSNGIPVPDIFLLISQFALLGPALAAIIVLAFSKGKAGVAALLKNAWNWRFKKWWLLAVVFLPFLIVGASFSIKLLVENKPFAFNDVGMPLVLFVVFLFFAGGPLEEFGWRGYALPILLKKHSLVVASLILGVLHGIWHLPLHFMDGTVQSYIPIWEFVAVTAVGAIIYSWLFIKTNGSLTAMIIHHWSANLASALLMYWDTSLGRWIFFGVQLVFAVLIVIVYRVNSSKADMIK